MKIILLASGRSSRMDPISDKNLLNFCGKPLFLRLIENAQNGGLDNFIIVTNPDNQEVINKILKKQSFRFEITTQKNLAEGQAGGIADGLELVDDEEAVFILGGNDLIEPSAYNDVLNASQNYDGGILAKEVESYFPGGYLEIKKENIITRIIEKPGSGKEPSNLVNIVTHYFKKAEDIKSALKSAASSKDDVYEVALQNLFQEKKFVAIKYDRTWNAIKYPWHVLDMMEVFMQNQGNSIDTSAKIASSAAIKGDNVVIAKDVKIFENAVIQGPCYIGEGSIVGNNALVRSSMIGKNCTVGYNTEIARSYLADNITTHYAYVGDSVIDSGVNFGAFSCTANMRLDRNPVKVSIKDDRINSGCEKLGAIVGREAQIGIHAMLMPGVKVSKNQLVEPGKVLK